MLGEMSRTPTFNNALWNVDHVPLLVVRATAHAFRSTCPADLAPYVANTEFGKDFWSAENSRASGVIRRPEFLSA